jgi:HK97 family phage portal protein
MGFLGNLIAEKRSEIDLSNLRTPKEWLMAAGGGVLTKAGTTVNERTAMSLSAVYSSVKIISWVMASLPLHVYSPSGRGKNRASNEPVYKLLHDAPNTEQTSFQWRSFMYAMQNLWGAGVSEIEYDLSFNPIALWPIPTWCITPKRTYGTKQLYYEILDPLTGEMRQLSPWQLIIFPALSASLDNWLSPIAQHRETIGAAMAAKEFGALTFGQGVNPAGILSGLKFPDEAGEATFVKKMNENYAGLSQSHRLMMLEEGIKFDRIGLPPEDAQYLETRRFDVAEIARIYNIPLFLLQEMSGTTSWGSGIEEMNLGFVSYTLRPYAVLSEQEFKMKLFGETELFA